MQTSSLVSPDTPTRGCSPSPEPPSTELEMLDKRDIQTLMYCVRLAETHGHWQQGSPARFPNELECKLAQLLRQADHQYINSAA